MDANVYQKALVKQLSPEVYNDGGYRNLRQTRLGELLTTDWHQNLVMAGVAYSMNLGSISATAHTALTGNAAPDLDQPEVIIAVDSGYLIPIEIDISIAVDDMDAYDDITSVVFYADRAAAVAAGATATVNTPVNLLDGGEAFAGRCFDIITADVTDPVSSDVLLARHWEITQVAAEVAGSVPAEKSAYKLFPVPTILKGPCQIVGYITGTNTPTFQGCVKFAHVPASWFE